MQDEMATDINNGVDDDTNSVCFKGMYWGNVTRQSTLLDNLNVAVPKQLHNIPDKNIRRDTNPFRYKEYVRVWYNWKMQYNIQLHRFGKLIFQHHFHTLFVLQMSTLLRKKHC